MFTILAEEGTGRKAGLEHKGAGAQADMEFGTNFTRTHVSVMLAKYTSIHMLILILLHFALFD